LHPIFLLTYFLLVSPLSSNSLFSVSFLQLNFNYFPLGVQLHLWFLLYLWRCLRVVYWMISRATWHFKVKVESWISRRFLETLKPIGNGRKWNSWEPHVTFFVELVKTQDLQVKKYEILSSHSFLWRHNLNNVFELDKCMGDVLSCCACYRRGLRKGNAYVCVYVCYLVLLGSLSWECVYVCLLFCLVVLGVE
jgi:hypothetical protein